MTHNESAWDWPPYPNLPDNIHIMPYNTDMFLPAFLSFITTCYHNINMTCLTILVFAETCVVKHEHQKAWDREKPAAA